jgi:hypothetical protein
MPAETPAPVTIRPFSSPAAPSSSAPVHTEVVHAVCGWGLEDPVDDRVPVCGVLGRDGTAGHKQHIRTRHIGERRVNAQVH